MWFPVLESWDMKTTIALLVLLSFVAGTVAQQSKPAQAPAQVQAAEVPNQGKVLQNRTEVEVATPPAEQGKKPPIAQPTVPVPKLKKGVVYGGFLTDLKRAERKRTLLSLRTPIDPVKDMENLWVDPEAPNKFKGTVLFSIKF